MEGNWELYRIFVAVAREGNISRAAARLFVSQSAVSQSVKQLEQRLEVPLFHRTPKGVVLTREGETLYSYAVTATGLLESAGRALAEMTALRAGHIRIGASDTVCSLFLVDVLRRFHAEHPDITINVLNRTSDEAVELLRQGEVDMA
ncbi:MAG: LysR family transcriptional regulator, partial [Oscillospiraceae bacterium]|nr:LysR family transcriptional regulator [Oscillospiraceae bacterium]